MWLTVLVGVVAVFALGMLVIMMSGSDASKRVGKRLDALGQELAPTQFEEKITDIRREQKKLSAIPLLNSWLLKMNLGPATTLFLYQAGVHTSIGTLILTSVLVAAAAASVVYLRFHALVPALVAAVLFFALPFLYVRHKRSSRLFQLEQQLPEALGMMVSALRVGHSLVASVGAVAQESQDPIASEMRKCFDEQNYGIDLRTALVNLTQRAPIQDFRIFVAAVLIQKESGGNLAEVLEKVAETTRERFRLKKQVSVHTAQGRLTGWILSILPIALGAGMYFVNPGSMSVLWTNPLGLKMLYAALTMDVIGALIIRRIVEIKV